MLCLPALLASMAGVAVFAAAAVALLVPSAWLIAALPTVSFALLASQLPFTCAPVQTLLSSSLARSCASIGLLLLSLACTPRSFLALYASLTASLGPALHAASSVALVEGVTFVSRAISRAMGSAANRDEPTTMHRMAILGFCAVCYALALRWIAVSVMAVTWSLADVTVFATLLLSCAYLTIRSIRSPRAVLSESAVVLLLVAQTLWSWVRARLTREQLHAWKESQHESWLWEHAVPYSVDIAALALLIIAAQMHLQTRQQVVEKVASRVASSDVKGTHSSASSNATLSAARCGAILLLTYLLQAWSGDTATGADKTVEPGMASHMLDSARRFMPPQTERWAAAAMQRLSEFAVSSRAPDDVISTFSTLVAGVSSILSAAFPRGFGALARGVAAAAYSFVRLHPRGDDDEHEE